LLGQRRRGSFSSSLKQESIQAADSDENSRMRLFIRTIGVERATTKIGLANLAYNVKRLIYLDCSAAT
jgi:hypothetical protein